MPRLGGMQVDRITSADVMAVLKPIWNKKALATVRRSTAGDGVRLSFELIVLTAARTAEVRGALWEEIDEDAGVWRVPGSRTNRSCLGRSTRPAPMAFTWTAAVQTGGCAGGGGTSRPGAQGGSRFVPADRAGGTTGRAWTEQVAVRATGDAWRTVATS